MTPLLLNHTLKLLHLFCHVKEDKNFTYFFFLVSMDTNNSKNCGYDILWRGKNQNSGISIKDKVYLLIFFYEFMNFCIDSQVGARVVLEQCLNTILVALSVVFFLIKLCISHIYLKWRILAQRKFCAIGAKWKFCAPK